MELVTVAREADVAVLTIDSPPVNAGDAALRAALHAALRRVEDDASLAGAVIRAAGPHFYAGSDMREFDGALASPTLPEVIDVIERLRIPVIAAVHGLALGGGLELALACDVRIGDPSARLGLPETSFGILPGAGGTVRATRLLGVSKTIELVSSARQVEAEEAIELGLLDRLVPAAELETASVAAAREAPRRRLVDVGVPPESRDAIDEAVERSSIRARANVVEAIDLIRRGASITGTDALAEERAAFDRLRVSEEARNLRYLFFARRAAAKGLKGAAVAKKVRSVGIAGAGTMGAGLARLFTAADFEVRVFDLREEALAPLAQAGIATTGDIGELADRELVVDAVFDDHQVKSELFATLEALDGSMIIATNTSYLDIDALAAALSVPSRFGGLHFFNPADRNPLVEVVRARATSPETIATLGWIAGRLGKVAIEAGGREGFVGNAVFSAYRTQAEFLVEEGAAPEQVDAAMVELGFAIGPFAVADMSGLDIAWARRKRLATRPATGARSVEIADRLCEAGRLGQKTGGGWYAYPDGARRGQPDPEVVRIVADARERAGVSPRAIPREEMQLRALASIVCAAAQLVTDGTAERASDIDVALTEGFGFRRWLGGPLRRFTAMAEPEQLRALQLVHVSCPVTFAIAAPVSAGEFPSSIRALLTSVP